MSADHPVPEHSSNEGSDFSSEREDRQIQTMGVRRTDYISCEDYFMAVAILTSERSKDPETQVGACIVNKEKRIVDVGYNGMPNGISDDKLPWCRRKENPSDNKHMYVCHAEMNAIMSKNSTDLAGCTIYVTLFPCNECAKLIIQAGIKKVIFLSDKYEHKRETVASKKMLDTAGVSYRKHKPDKTKIILDFMKNTEASSQSTAMDCEDSSMLNKGEGQYTHAEKKRKLGGDIDSDDEREDSLALDEYFMALAHRSKDPSTQVGACIVNKANKIIGIGHNGLPRGCSEEALGLGKNSPRNSQEYKLYVCHAEVNAIMNKHSGDVDGCTIYVTFFPCNECVKIIIQAGIKKVVYLSDGDKESPKASASKKMLDLAGIPYIECNLP